MTLKEKILQVANDLEKEAITYPKMKTMDVVNIVLRRLANEHNEEKIAEDFAIEFAEWLIDGHVSKLTLEEFKKQKETNMCQYCGLENGNHKLSCPVIKVTMIL